MACTSVPAGRSAIQSITLRGDDSLDESELRERLASTESPRFLGLFTGIIYDYSVFDRFVLERDLQRIERYYRAQGYYQTRVRAGRVSFVKSNRVKVEIVIEEGPPLLIRRVDVHGLEALPPPLSQKVQRAVRRALKVGRPFQEERLSTTSDAITRVLMDSGYAFAKVERAADVDLPKNAAALGFWITPGPSARFGEVKIVGLGEIPEAPVRRALAIEMGTPFSRAELDSAERALLDLNVFSSVIVTPDLSQASSNEGAPLVPITVRVEPSKLRGIHLGGGVQLDSIQTDTHVLAGWENRNLFGGLRSLTAEVKPGVVLYPTRIPSLRAPTRLLPEGRANAEFRQPGFLEARTAFLTRIEGSIAPVILSPDQTTGAILGYRDARLSAGLDRSFWRLYGSLSHTVQLDSAFTYAGPLDPDLRFIVISYPEAFLSLDLRDQRTHPHEGAYLSADVQVAGVGGDARDFHSQTEGRFYVPITRHVTLAGRANVGLLFPQNYGGTIEDDALGKPFPLQPTSDPALAGVRRGWVRDVQLMFLRGFFAGGPASNRGYALREIGPHGVVPQASSTLAKTCTGSDLASGCNLPLGGFTLWEASLELRFPISGALTGAAFTDTADVSGRELNFRFNRPHLSTGFGFRYDTPVGPIRLDAGYRIPGLQAPSAADEGVPAKTFGLPMAISFGIGEAF